MTNPYIGYGIQTEVQHTDGTLQTAEQHTDGTLRTKTHTHTHTNTDTSTHTHTHTYTYSHTITDIKIKSLSIVYILYCEKLGLIGFKDEQDVIFLLYPVHPYIQSILIFASNYPPNEPP